MIIKKIDIEGLHDEHNYSVVFDPKITFLYGSNGCGKTTILNILASIVTGKLYNLMDYSFKKIKLQYLTNEELVQDIVIGIDICR